MKKFLMLITVSFALVTLSHAQVKVGDATLPSKLTFKEQSLVLNGAGIRKKLWFKLYSAGLYLPKKSTNASAIVNDDITTAIRLDITSGLISTSKLIGAVRDGFQKTNDASTVAKLQSKLETFINYLDGEINVGDKYDIIYLPTEGLSISKNGTHKGTIEGLDFKKAIFNIWLADTPVDEVLKESLLKN